MKTGKLAHLTQRKNILVELMQDVSCMQEVKENLIKNKQLLEDFKDTHEAFNGLLTEEEARNECEWFEPKIT